MKTLRKLSSWFYDHATGRLVLFFLVLLLPFSAYIFPTMQKKMGQGEQADVLDIHFGFTSSEASEVLDKMGEQGRGIYQITELVVDSLYPILYTFFLIFLLSLLVKKVPFRDTRLSLLNLFPLLTTLFDFSENTGIVTLINQFPTLSPTTVLFTSLANMGKWGTAIITVLLILAGTFLFFKNRKK